ncbi:MAG TPA: hypothetical protein VGJ32_14160 [Solirubrobacteraceae bacterium]
MPSRILAPAVAALALLALPAGALAKGTDRNHDGLPDSWEKRHHLSLNVKQATRDTDDDGLNNRGEYRRKTDPQRPDSDRDGLEDGAEVRTGNNPRRRDTDGDGIADGKENAGKVASLRDGVLTITLPDGSEVSGRLTDATRVSCSAHDEREVESETATSHHRRGSTTARAARNGDPQPPASGGGSSSASPSDTAAAPADDSGRHGDGTEDETENETEHSDESETEHSGGSDRSGPGRSRSCAATELKAGLPVHEAKLMAGTDGMVFEEVEVLK